MTFKKEREKKTAEGGEEAEEEDKVEKGNGGKTNIFVAGINDRGLREG